MKHININDRGLSASQKKKIETALHRFEEAGVAVIRWRHFPRSRRLVTSIVPSSCDRGAFEERGTFVWAMDVIARTSLAG